MSWQHFLAIASAHFLALLSPGPDFLLLVKQSLCNGRASALQLALGIALANLVFIVVALAGVELIRHDSTAFYLLYWAGCAYLGWLGWQFWLARHVSHLEQAAAAPPAQQRQALLSGLLSGLLNPKNALFYLALFALLLPADTPLGLRGATGLWMFLVVLGWDCLIVLTLTRGALARRFASHLGTLHRVCALLLWSVVGWMCTSQIATFV
ncbi:LysE family translocator [Chitinibacteraceae bacterium HSL-7]